MKLLRQSLLFLVGLIIMILIVLLFAKKDYSFEKKIFINSSSSDVFNFLKFLKNQEKYNDWYMTQKNAHFYVTGEDGTTSAKFHWKSNSSYLRNGYHDIRTLNYPESISIDIATDDSYNIKGRMDFQLKEKNSQTHLTWKIHVHFPFPYNIVILTDDFEKSLLKSMDISLNNIKKELEK
jgi:hypothetical protein